MFAHNIFLCSSYVYVGGAAPAAISFARALCVGERPADIDLESKGVQCPCMEEGSLHSLTLFEQ